MRDRGIVVLLAGLVALVTGGVIGVVVLGSDRSIRRDASGRIDYAAQPGGMETDDATFTRVARDGTTEITADDIVDGEDEEARRAKRMAGGPSASSPRPKEGSVTPRPRVTPVRPAISRRHFRLAASDTLERAVTQGDWTIADGRATATASSVSGGAALTLPTYYAEIERLTIRGGLDAESPYNFRVQVGPVSLIFNWEVARENHYRMGTRRTAKRPPALVPGQEHEIVLEQRDDIVHLSVDGEALWEAKGTLHGPVTVYPAGSTIFVREIVVKGRAVPDVEVTGPAYPLQ